MTLCMEWMENLIVFSSWSRISCIKWYNSWRVLCQKSLKSLCKRFWRSWSEFLKVRGKIPIRVFCNVLKFSSCSYSLLADVAWLVKQVTNVFPSKHKGIFPDICWPVHLTVDDTFSSGYIAVGTYYYGCLYYKNRRLCFFDGLYSTKSSDNFGITL